MHHSEKPLRLGFLASHNGSTMKAIIKAIERGELAAEVGVIISNNSQSGALQFAKQRHYPHRHISRKTEGDEEQLDKTICHELQRHEVNLVILSGWMLLLRSYTLLAYEKKILNSHPALFSSPYKGQDFFGDKVHQAVLAAKEKVTGVTIHLADGQYDHGDVLAEAEVAVMDDDTVETLKQRVQERERALYLEVLQSMVLG